MCGIFGVLASRTAPYPAAFLDQALRTLVERSQSRGRDSSGLVFRAAGVGAHDVFKAAIPIGDLMAMAPVKARLTAALDAASGAQRQPFVVMGHSRLVTNGSQRHDVNNQPVVKSGIIGVHNGIVVNDAALWTRHPNQQREFEIDTEVILAILRESLDAGRDVPSAVAQVEAEIEGTASLAILVPDRAILILYTNNGSLYTLRDGQGLLCFASEFFPLRALAERTTLRTNPEVAIGPVECGSGVIVNLESLDVTTFRTRDHRNAHPALDHVPVPGSITVLPVVDGRRQPELVRDVALIAGAADAKRFERMLECNHDRVARLRRCSACILPETFPFIAFDERGVCNYCRDYRPRNRPKPLDELLAMLEPYRRPGSGPDAILPYSGGRDSTYALHFAKTVLGLKPVAFTYDWGMVTDLGRRNIARVCGKLQVENIIVAADIHWKRANIRKNIEAWLRRPHLGMVPLFMAGDKWFYWYVETVKRQTGIALNIWGVNPLENTDFKVGFMGVGPDPHKKRIYSLSARRQATLFAKAAGIIAGNPGYLNRSVFDTLGGFLSRSVKRHRDYYHLFDYVRWDEDEINTLLRDEYRWERAIDTDTTWRIGDGTAAFYNYIYFTVAGFSEHDSFRSNQIREGAIARDEALRLVNTENRPRYPTFRWYTDAVGVDYEHAVRVINAIPKLYA